MRSSVRLPKLSEAGTEVVVDSWLVSVGDTVTQGAPILCVETDKVVAEVPTPVAGTVLELLVQPGDEIATGDRICVIGAT